MFSICKHYVQSKAYTPPEPIGTPRTSDEGNGVWAISVLLHITVQTPPRQMAPKLFCTLESSGKGLKKKSPSAQVASHSN